jgi:hypothetical protein
MLDADTLALLRSVLNELCKDLSKSETGMRTRVASGILEAATKDGWSVDNLKEAGRKAMRGPPTMWP